jgi:biopolymer transport protein ExbD
MALSVNGGGNGSRRRSRYMSSIADINVTPFVDVLLVVLVIFMMTANVMEFGLEIDVPTVTVKRESAQELPVITILKDGQLFLGENPVNVNQLAAEVKRRYANQKAVYVRADKQTNWDPIAQVVSQLGEAKLGVNMVTKSEDLSTRKLRP